MYLKVNPNNLHVVGPVKMPTTGLSFQMVDAVHVRVKSMFSTAIFLDNNLGPYSYPAFPSALNWVPDQLHLYRPSRYKHLNCYSLLANSFLEPTQGHHKTVLPSLYLLASISYDKVWQSILLGTLIVVAAYINVAATQGW